MPEPRAIPLSSDGVEVVIDLTEPRPFVSGFVGDRFDIDGSHTITVFGPNDPIVQDLIDIEETQLVALGDRAEDAHEWLADRDGGAWITLFESDAPQDAEHALGLVRTTTGRRGSRPLRDLSILLSRDPDQFEQDARTRFGFEPNDDSLKLMDHTTLDITDRGAPTKLERLMNLERLARMQLVAIVRAAQTDGSDVALSLVNPKVYAHLLRFGWPMLDFGLGVLDYRLFADHETPMPTMFVWGYSAEVADRLKAGSTSHLAGAAKALTDNGFHLEVPEGTRERFDLASAKVGSFASLNDQLSSRL